MVHPSVVALASSPDDMYGDALASMRTDGEKLKYVDKVAIAEYIVRSPIDLSRLDLRDRVAELLELIVRANQS